MIHGYATTLYLVKQIVISFVEIVIWQHNVISFVEIVMMTMQTAVELNTLSPKPCGVKYFVAKLLLSELMGQLWNIFSEYFAGKLPCHKEIHLYLWANWLFYDKTALYVVPALQ